MSQRPPFRLTPPIRLSALAAALTTALPVQAAQESMADNALAGLPGVLIASLALGYALWSRRQESRLQEELALLRQRHDALKKSLVPTPSDLIPTTMDEGVQLPELLDQALEECRRDGSRVSVLVVDLCRFARINDCFGRAGGDLLLGRVLERLQGAVRDTDRVIRLNGDRFGVVQKGFHHQEGVERLAGKLLKALEAPFEVAGQAVYLAAAVGSALAPDDGLDGRVLMEDAALALEQARSLGGGHLAFTSEVRRCLEERRQLTLDLHHALPREQLTVRFRVASDLRNQRIAAVEARLHWQHPRLGTLIDEAFLPLAEAGGLVTALNEWLLYRACLQVAQWRERFAGMRLIVRLSADFLAGEDLMGNLLQILADTGLTGDALELVVPMAVFDHRREASIVANLTALKDLGINLALDQVRPDYLPFDRLRRFGIVKLRLASWLTEGLLEDADTATVVRILIALGHELGMTVAAEGVEAAEQARHLRGLNCDQAQGGFFGLDLPAEELHLLLCQRRRVA